MWRGADGTWSTASSAVFSCGRWPRGVAMPGSRTARRWRRGFDQSRRAAWGAVALASRSCVARFHQPADAGRSPGWRGCAARGCHQRPLRALASLRSFSPVGEKLPDRADEGATVPRRNVLTFVLRQTFRIVPRARSFRPHPRRLPQSNSPVEFSSRSATLAISPRRAAAQFRDSGDQIAPQSLAKVQSQIVIRGWQTDGVVGRCSSVRVLVSHGHLVGSPGVICSPRLARALPGI